METERPPEPSINHLPEPQPNPAIGILRFFVWLMPTAIAIGCVFLAAWIEQVTRGNSQWPAIALLLAVVGLLLCGWFDSALSLPCRLEKRSRGLHILIFTLTEVFLVIPALLFATVYAICAIY